MAVVRSTSIKVMLTTRAIPTTRGSRRRSTTSTARARYILGAPTRRPVCVAVPTLAPVRMLLPQLGGLLALPPALDEETEPRVVKQRRLPRNLLEKVGKDDELDGKHAAAQTAIPAPGLGCSNGHASPGLGSTFPRRGSNGHAAPGQPAASDRAFTRQRGDNSHQPTASVVR